MHSHQLPNHPKIDHLIQHATQRGVLVYQQEDRPGWTYHYGATSGSTGAHAYDVLIHATEHLGIDDPILVHCDCMAGTHGKPCSHAALALKAVALAYPWNIWVFLDADQATLPPDELRATLPELEGVPF